MIRLALRMFLSSFPVRLIWPATKNGKGGERTSRPASRPGTVSLLSGGRATKMHNWRVGSVGSVSGENFWGVGFVLYDEIGKPCLTFGYFNESSAKAGREHVVAALANAASVTGARQPQA